jgi:hypothetical protein
MQARALKEELENEKLRGRLIEAEPMQEMFRSEITRMRQFVMTAPSLLKRQRPELGRDVLQALHDVLVGIFELLSTNASEHPQ